jgi:hypothetical protein
VNVWVVERGQYSDRHIVRIFSTQAAADAYTKHMNRPGYESDNCTVAEFTVDTDYDRDQALWLVRIIETRGVADPISIEPVDGEWYGSDAYDAQTKMHYWFYPRRHAEEWTTYVNAPDEERAAKIAYDRLAEWKAAHAGVLA